MAVAGSPPLASELLRKHRGRRKAPHRGRVGGKNDNGEWLHSPHSCPKPPRHWALSTKIPPGEGNSWEVSKLEGMNCAFRSRCYCSSGSKDVNRALSGSPYTILCPVQRIASQCVLMVSSPKRVPNAGLPCALVSVTLKLFTEKLMALTDFICSCKFTVSHPIWSVLCFAYRPNCPNRIFT